MKIKASKILAVVCVIAMIMTMIVPMSLTAAAADETVEISFASTAQRTEQSTAKQVWANAGVTFTNDKAASTSNVGNYSNPARLYASSSVTITAPGTITKIDFVCNNDSYATALKNSIGDSATKNGTTITVTPNADEFTITKLTAQVRLNKLIVTYAAGGNSGCDHAETIAIGAAKAATCTESGITAGKKCADPECDAILEAQTTIPALGHNFVEGVCDRCGEIGPVYSYTFISGAFGNSYTEPKTVALGDVNWTIDVDGSTFFGFDSNSGRGIQIGKSAEPASAIVLTSDSFKNVSKIVINTAGASGTDANLTVTVGGKQIGNSISTTTSATEYEFTSETPISGAIELNYTLTKAAVYIKSIEVYCTEPVFDINAVGAYMNVAYKYTEDNGTLSNSWFVLKCGVDATLADIAGDASYGIAVTAGGKTVYYTSETANSWAVGDNKISVAINLGDIINDTEKLETEFTVRAFVEIGDEKIESTSTKTYSVAGMIDAYNAAGIEAVAHLYGILFPSAN